MAVWTVYLSICLLVALNASVETCPVENKDCGTCKDGWSAYGCRCFKFFNNPSSWSYAEYTCLYSYDGHIASVHSHEEYIFIKNLIRRTTHASTPSWIGLHKIYRWGHWYWSDGTQLNYQIWSPGQPSRGKDEHCIEMNSVNGNWKEVKCDESKPYVCVK